MKINEPLQCSLLWFKYETHIICTATPLDMATKWFLQKSQAIKLLIFEKE